MGVDLSFTLPDIVAIGGMLVSVVMFVIMASSRTRKALSIESVLLADRSANSSQFGASFAAASSSLATVLIFFLNTSVQFGYLLFWCGATYLFGQIVFIRFLKDKVKIQTSEMTTNADFFLGKTGSIFSSRVIAFLTFFTFLAILFLEIYIGSEILRYYIGLSSNVAQLIAFTLLGLVVISYVRLGGLRVVFKTDVWQLLLMSLACIALLIFAFLQPASENQAAQRSYFEFAATGNDVIWFMAWILVVNLTLPFTQLSSWQRLAATKSTKEAYEGLIKTIPQFSIIWFIPVIAFIILNAKGLQFGSLSDVFDSVKAIDPTIAVALFPLIFVGFASALFSTADTALVALQFSISDRATFGPVIAGKSERRIGTIYLVMTSAIVALLGALYALAESYQSWFMPLIFIVFGQLTIIAPQLIYALRVHSGRWTRRSFTPAATFWNVLGLLIAWIIAVGAGVIETMWGADYAEYQEAATFLALAISTAFLALAVRISPEATASDGRA